MKNSIGLLLSTAAVLLTSVPALADTASYAITTLNPIVAAGGTATFSGIIAAPASNAGLLQLLGDTSTTGAYTVDDTDFQLDTPFTLSPGAFYNGPLFTVTLPGNASGTYTGFFDIQFADASSNTFYDNAQFSLSTPAVAATPEPGSWLLLSTGMACALMLRRRYAAARA